MSDARARDLTEWHTSEVLGRPFEERRDVDSGLTTVRLRITAATYVSDKNMASPIAAQYIKREVWENLTAEVRRVEYEMLHEPTND